ncbi:MAG: hypothetical protein COU07_04180 [Candidatus Harrisonbacteria bacterium CG10_big_fil_rev_8_21_14_0_10_40_38]|uniref:GGDEF domain-containing protein n=1 Tax=Candidatus Harrisonbacteria bacterium CG10_big_fil_rev_8_21_14_0_10_40_38 TaxID=1974583 RepID=A0A2H0UR11_9BACT|nr:MAG: hypothetical protein COU07_04180 [Candidatus Harrisonbacteria bacterium CG10_big_fil_rev_8_21_14_0_10_40_38]
MSDELQKLKSELRDRDRKIKELESLVFTDPLTGLYNRRGFLALAKKLYSDVSWMKSNKNSPRTHFYVDSFTILFFDIDNFKSINDKYGHEIGDQILKFSAQIIESKVRASDFVGRWGGEEMVAALIGASEKDGFLKAEEIRKAIKSRVHIPKDLSRKITMSVGVAELTGKSSLENLVKAADEAMYKAKTTGKDKTVKYSQI